MKPILALCLAVAGLAGCAAQPAPAPTATAAPVQAAPPQAAPAETPIAAGGRWEVATARCSAILAATDDDRAAVGMFYLGYLAARADTRIIEIARIEPDLARVFAACNAHPDMRIVDAFATLRRRR